MKFAAIFLKSAALVIAALAAFWAAAAFADLEPSAIAGIDCAAVELRACFFAII